MAANCMYVFIVFYCAMLTPVQGLVLLSYHGQSESYDTELQCDVGCEREAHVHS